MKLLLNFLRAYSFSTLILVGIFCVCTMPMSNLPKVPQFKGLDKLVHLIMYVCLTIALFSENKGQRKLRHYFYILLFPVLYGGAIELVQLYFFPPRTAEWSDFLADFLGVLIGYFLAKALSKLIFIQKIFKF